jgi:hypothetical protein
MAAWRDRTFGSAGTATGCGGFSRRFDIVMALAILPRFMGFRLAWPTWNTG